MGFRVQQITASDTEDSKAAEPDRLIRLPEVVAMTGLSRSTIYRYMAAGTFPLAVDLGENAVAWWWSEVEAWRRARPRIVCRATTGQAKLHGGTGGGIAADAAE